MADDDRFKTQEEVNEFLNDLNAKVRALFSEAEAALPNVTATAGFAMLASLVMDQLVAGGIKTDKAIDLTELALEDCMEMVKKVVKSVKAEGTLQ